MRCPFAVLSLCLASVAAAEGPKVDIITSESPPPLVQRAANELAADLKRLYDAEVRIGVMLPAAAPHVILIGVADAGGHLQHLSEPLPKLAEQGHAVLSRKLMGRPVLAVVGGSPAATYWAGAELALQLGIRTMLYGDVDPVAPRKFSVEGFDIVMAPRKSERAWQMDFDSPIGPASWGLADQKKLLRQLARLKFNRLVLSTKADTPAAAIAAFRPIPVSGDTAGRAAFGGAKFFDNPDLAAAKTGAARLHAAQQLIDGLESEAKALGMTVHRSSAGDKSQPVLNNVGLLPHPYLMVTIRADAIGDADLLAFTICRNEFDGKLFLEGAVRDLVTPVCGDGVSDRVFKAFTLAAESSSLIAENDDELDTPAPDTVMRHYASAEPPPKWWATARDNYLNAMNEMYRANTRARDGGRSFTLYFARRFEFAFEYMNVIEAVRKAGIARSKGDKETQLAELEKAVESMTGALNAMAAVARSQSDRAIIAVLNEYGYRPLVKESENAL